MPYFQCPRCGGTDSYGQWEQRFTNQNITYRDNNNRQVGSSNGGFGVSNVRQQYCNSCVSVKMDMKFSKQDWRILGAVAKVLVALTLINLLFVGAIKLKDKLNFHSIESISIPNNGTYFLISFIAFCLGSASIFLFRKIWIKKEDKKFLDDRFYRPRPPRSKKFMFGWFILIFICINALYLFSLT